MESIVTKKESDLAALKELYALWHKYDMAYFWHPPGVASARRAMEAANTIKKVYELENMKIVVDISVECSCKNVYVTRRLYVNGERKTARVLSSLIKKLTGDNK